MKTIKENNKRRRSSLDSTSENSKENQGNGSSLKSRKTTLSRESILKDMDTVAAIPNYLKSTSSSSRKEKPMNAIDSADVLSASSNSDTENTGGAISSGPLTSAHKQLLQQQWVIEANGNRQSLPVDEDKGETEVQIQKSNGLESSSDQFIDHHFQFNDVYADNEEDGKSQASSENEHSREVEPPEKRIQPSPSKNLNTNFKEVNTIIAAPRPRVVIPLKPRGGMPPEGEEESGDDYNSSIRVVKRSENGIKKHGASSAASISMATQRTAETKLAKEIPSTGVAVSGDLPAATSTGVNSRKNDIIRVLIFGLIFISVSIALTSIFVVTQQPAKERTSAVKPNHFNSNTQIFDKNSTKSKVPDTPNFNMDIDLLSQAFRTLDGSISNIAGFPDFKMDKDLDILSASMLRQLEELEGEALQLRIEVRYTSDDDVYLINYNMAVGYKIYLHTNTAKPERRKYTSLSTYFMYSTCIYIIHIYVVSL
jgi:hypothetical protein